MVLRKLLVNGIPYGRGTTDIGVSRRKRLIQEGKLSASQKKDFFATLRLMEKKTKRLAKGAAADEPHVNWIDGSDDDPHRTLAADFGKLDSEQGRHIYYMLLNMALDHSVEFEQGFDEDGRPVGEPRLSASSPEEVGANAPLLRCFSAHGMLFRKPLCMLPGSSAFLSYHGTWMKSAFS